MAQVPRDGNRAGRPRGAAGAPDFIRSHVTTGMAISSGEGKACVTHDQETPTMIPRLTAAPNTLAPRTYEAMLELESRIAASGLEKTLLELVKTRVSQINGCAYCLHMHTGDARRAGESEARLYLLSAWRESALYSERERAALAWAEALTLVSQTHAPDEDYALVEAQFSEEERVNLTFAIGAINLWNRLAIGFRAVHPADVSRAAA
jgi:AhpD family alkylhydroperoxidase